MYIFIFVFIYILFILFYRLTNASPFSALPAISTSFPGSPRGGGSEEAFRGILRIPPDSWIRCEMFETNFKMFQSSARICKTCKIEFLAN